VNKLDWRGSFSFGGIGALRIIETPTLRVIDVVQAKRRACPAKVLAKAVVARTKTKP